ncbi:hypothetical protein ABW19_dt0207529 [Dactylella cylindrospora]|nr:hypothetical protein ABW19_dt0207529 [Dactylella cylindrospora]
MSPTSSLQDQDRGRTSISYESAARDISASRAGQLYTATIYGQFTPGNLLQYKPTSNGKSFGSTTASPSLDATDAGISTSEWDLIRYKASVAQTVAYAMGGESDEEDTRGSHLELESNYQPYSIRSVDITSEQMGPLEPKIDMIREKAHQYPMPLISPRHPFPTIDEDQPLNDGCLKNIGFRRVIRSNESNFSSDSLPQSPMSTTWSDAGSSSTRSTNTSMSVLFNDSKSVVSEGIALEKEELLLGTDTAPVSSLGYGGSLELSVADEPTALTNPTEEGAQGGDEDTEEITRKKDVITASILNLKTLDQAVRRIRQLDITGPHSVPFFLSNIKAFKQTVKYFQLLKIANPSLNRGSPTRIPKSLVDSQRSQLLEMWGSHLGPSEIAEPSNWRDIRQRLPDMFKFTTFSNDVWTIDASTMPSYQAQLLPLWIAQRPLILNYAPAVVGCFESPPDPVAHQPIDPRKDLSDRMLHLLFRTYTKAKAACILLNHTLLLLYEGTLDLESELIRRPRKFGGLDISWLPFSQVYTSSLLDAAQLGYMMSRDDDSPVISDVGSKIDTSYNPTKKLRWKVRKYLRGPPSYPLTAGIRVRHKISKQDALTVALHGLLHAATKTIKYSESKQETFTELRDETQKRFTFHFQGQEFGTFEKHFEKNIKAAGRRQVTLDHDLALVQAMPGKSKYMPFLVFRDENDQHVQLEWMDPECDFIDKPIYLLGFDFASKRHNYSRENVSTRTEEGAIVIPLGEFDHEKPKTHISDPDINSVPDTPDNSTKTMEDNNGRFLEPPKVLSRPSSGTSLDELSGDEATLRPSSSEEDVLVGSTVKAVGGIIGRMVKPQRVASPIDKSRTIRERRTYFQRSYIWRTDFRRTKDGQLLPPARLPGEDQIQPLPDIAGASGCALATKSEEDGVTKYKIFGFQNAEIGLDTDQPDLDPKEYAENILHATFKTYQSLYLPKELIENWEIVWTPDTAPDLTPASTPAFTPRSRWPSEVFSRSIGADSRERMWWNARYGHQLQGNG